VLGVLGWDPTEAACGVCAATPSAFHVGRQEFFCDLCAVRSPRKDLVLLRKA